VFNEYAHEDSIVCCPRTRPPASGTRQPIAGVSTHHRSSGRYLFTVAQILNLPYRRFVIGRASVTPKTLDFAGDPQVTNQLCSAWSAGSRNTVVIIL
jgi:hypothetical protein